MPPATWPFGNKAKIFLRAYALGPGKVEGTHQGSWRECLSVERPPFNCHANKCLTADSDEEHKPYDGSDYTPDVDYELGVGQYAQKSGF